MIFTAAANFIISEITFPLLMHQLSKRIILRYKRSNSVQSAVFILFVFTLIIFNDVIADSTRQSILCRTNSFRWLNQYVSPYLALVIVNPSLRCWKYGNRKNAFSPSNSARKQLCLYTQAVKIPKSSQSMSFAQRANHSVPTSL